MLDVFFPSAIWRAISPTTVFPAPVGAQTITLWPARIEDPAESCQSSRGKEKCRCSSSLAWSIDDSVLEACNFCEDLVRNEE